METYDSSVNWGAHKTACKETDEDDEVTTVRSHGQHLFVRRAGPGRMVVQTDDHAYQDL